MVKPIKNHHHISEKKVWPKDIIEPDLSIQCKDNSDDNPHQHLAHAFPFYLLSVYFQKAILFSNPTYRPIVTVKRLELPFSCAVVQELINFAYDSKCNITDQNKAELLQIANYTISTRMVEYIQAHKAKNDKN